LHKNCSSFFVSKHFNDQKTDKLIEYANNLQKDIALSY